MPLPINLDALIHGKAVEWERLEFKEGWNPLDILHTICAFANDFHNLGGGYVVVGVAEKDGRPILPPVGLGEGTIDGIQKEILNLGHSSIQPDYHPVVVPEVFEGRTILVIWVPGGATRPYKAKLGLGKDVKEWGYFIRKGSSTVRAKGRDEAELLSLAATVPFDDRLNQRARVEDLSRDLMRGFLEEIGSDLAEKARSAPALKLGRQMNVIGGPKEAPFPLNVGLLFFNPEPRRFFPYTQIDVVWFPDGPGGDRFTEKTFRGPLHHMVREALDYIKRNHLSETVIKYPDRAESSRVANFPYDAVEEAVVNAIYHRSYEEREPVEVRITPEELVVLSFPGPDRSVSLDQLRAGLAATRRYRNRRIGEFLKELDLTEGRATGIPKILRAMRENGSPAPEFESDEDRTSFLIRLPVHPMAKLTVGADRVAQVQTGKGTAEPESTWRSRPEWRLEWRPESIHDRIMAAITLKPLSRSKIAAAVGHKSISGAFNRALAQLLELGLIEYTLPEKPQSRLQMYRARLSA
jgi:ATP-dependent DNA helicase RecG